jgi:hypothetical protein
MKKKDNGATRTKLNYVKSKEELEALWAEAQGLMDSSTTKRETENLRACFDCVEKNGYYGGSKVVEVVKEDEETIAAVSFAKAEIEHAEAVAEAEAETEGDPF